MEPWGKMKVEKQGKALILFCKKLRCALSIPGSIFYVDTPPREFGIFEMFLGSHAVTTN
jgi:hypothetical protein